MTEPIFNFYYRVDLTVRRYTTAGGTESVTYKFVDRQPYGSSSYTDFWPVLTGVPGEIVLAAGINLPTVTTGTFTIDNTIGSFGWKRKFSDILQRFTALEQTVVFYIGTADVNVNDTPTWTQIATGICNSWKAAPDGDGQQVNFEVRSTVLKDRVLTLDVATSVSGMSSASPNVLGKPVPFIVGSAADTPLVRVSANGSTSPRWAFGSCPYQSLKTEATTPVLYSLNADGAWELGSFSQTNYYSGVGGTAHTLMAYEAQAFHGRHLAYRGRRAVRREGERGRGVHVGGDAHRVRYSVRRKHEAGAGRDHGRAGVPRGLRRL